MGFPFVVTVLILSSLYEVSIADNCTYFNDTNCSSCTEKGDNCYWCPNTKECLDWNWGHLPNCKGHRYFYGQCDLNGVGIIILFTVGVFLLLIGVVFCCICCCCCCKRRRRRKEYNLLTPGDTHERQRRFQARRDEIRHKYGLDNNDATV